MSSTFKRVLDRTGLLPVAILARRRFRSLQSGGVYGREMRAVTRGIRQYQEELGSGTDVYMLRRNVHMIEKGLTMKPRRDTFAVDYIVQTITTYSKVLSSGLLVEDAAEFQWMTMVLSEYFKATLSSPNDKIAEARSEFRQATAKQPPSLGQGHGPHAAALLKQVQIDDLVGLAQGRRSVRWFTDQDVPREVVDRAIQVAAEAPTACNRQPYRFEVFDDPESVAKVADVPMGTKGYAHQLKGLVVIVGDLSAFFDRRDRHLIYVDSSLAAMGLIFGLESQGVASCSINWPDIPEREKRMHKLLGLKPWERVVMLLAYGYPDSAGLAPFSAKRTIDLVRSYRAV